MFFHWWQFGGKYMHMYMYMYMYMCIASWGVPSGKNERFLVGWFSFAAVNFIWLLYSSLPLALSLLSNLSFPPSFPPTQTCFCVPYPDSLRLL